MKLTPIILFIGTLLLQSAIGYCFLPADEIELAKRFAQLDSLAKSDSTDARQQIIAACVSEKERTQVQRYAFRLLSRTATSSELEQIRPVACKSQAAVYFGLAAIRVKARENNTSKSDLAKEMLAFVSELSRSSEPGASSRTHVAKEELGFYIADAKLPETLFPKEITSRSPEISLLRLRTQFASCKDENARAEFLARLLDTEDCFVREAATALMAELGDKAIPVVERVMEENVPLSDPPPFTAGTNAFGASIDVLAAIGGERARELLGIYAASTIRYVSVNAKYASKWVEAGVPLPIAHRRLFENPWLLE